MFNEHVWGKYFMVLRSHQTFFFSQRCSLNVYGKVFDTMGIPGGGTFPRYAHIILGLFLLHICFSDDKLAFLGVRVGRGPAAIALRRTPKTQNSHKLDSIPNKIVKN